MAQSRLMELVVGLFICLGVGAMFIMTYSVSDLRSAAVDNGYNITAKFDNIGGLKVGSSVQMAGVTVGRVTDIVIDRDRFVAQVDMQIDGQYNNLPLDTSAGIMTAGLLGEKYIGLSAGGDPEPLSEGGEIFITESALILEQVIGQFLFSKAAEGDSEE